MEGEAKTISARLRNPELWELFHREETEMIITKDGRCMFPVPDFSLVGLEPNLIYHCSIEAISVDSNRYQHKPPQGWVCAGIGKPLDHCHSRYLHPDSASLGQYWMREGAIFDKLKLSNRILPSGGNIVLNSLQKYRLRLIITKLHRHDCDRWVFEFPETTFIAVTRYQNTRMTQLKIDNNPMATAFREGKRRRRPPVNKTPPPAPPLSNWPVELPRPEPPRLSHDWPQDQKYRATSAPVNRAGPPAPPLSNWPVELPIPEPPRLSHDWPQEMEYRATWTTDEEYDIPYLHF